MSSVHETDSSPDGDYKSWSDSFTVVCRGCKTVSFLEETSNSESYFYDTDAGDEKLNITTRVFPNQLANRSSLEHAHLLPEAVHRIYDETRSSLVSGYPVLSGIGIRAIVETVCKDQSAYGKDLKQKIDNLPSLNVITPAGAQILHSLRFMGNDAAHEVKAHKSEELSTAFDVIDHLLQGTYVLPELAKRLPKRKTP